MLNYATEPGLNGMSSCLHMSCGFVYLDRAEDLMGNGPCKVGRLYLEFDSENI